MRLLSFGSVTGLPKVECRRRCGRNNRHRPVRDNGIHVRLRNHIEQDRFRITLVGQVYLRSPATGPVGIQVHCMTEQAPESIARTARSHRVPCDITVGTRTHDQCCCAGRRYRQSWNRRPDTQGLQMTDYARRFRGIASDPHRIVDIAVRAVTHRITVDRPEVLNSLYYRKCLCRRRITRNRRDPQQPGRRRRNSQRILDNFGLTHSALSPVDEMRSTAR
ncbi:hypothetical protein NRB20_66660 [Nocardia sp. RB20]|uniref:Uncharacterized protein n=1 Tax=Nocardia macrotermitis TaxID=2585198 RepID=A0A7K0DCM7_9NOCA|nr:hypothetical protein [Nocardia macrotermitis]